ncbi:hypothetical protein ISS05_00240 [Candidatus Woesearchaeota archaeon]|nr:hypothetical protein [Candidatus Woesearchaeota archaeon]
MFIRVKNIKNKKGKIYPYAYLVDNKWYKRSVKGKGKGSRQKVKKYLGRVYSFSKVKDVDFFEYLKIDNIDAYLDKNYKEKILKNLVEWEFLRYDVDKSEFSVDFLNKKVSKGNREVSLKLNEGLLNSFTLGRLLRFRFKGDEREDGYNLAKAFVEAGIEIPKEVFVGIFSKVYK